MRCPFATWKPLSQNATQSRIIPTQIIFHSATASNIDSVWQYMEDGSGGAHTESHFIVGYDGTIIQAMDTQVRADAQFAGNTSGVSIETASNASASDPWTSQQIESLAKLGKWLSEVHHIPATVCHDFVSPGLGYHRLFTEWNLNAHSCPGNARVAQFPSVVHAIAAPPQPKPKEEHPEDDMFYVRAVNTTAVYRSNGQYKQWVTSLAEWGVSSANVVLLDATHSLLAAELIGPAPTTP
jgi:N-acetylmuramoyl-L-alanine amidase